MWTLPAVLLPADYLAAIQRAGGVALMIAPDGALREDPDELLDHLDGLILAGGSDIDPGSYGAQAHPQTRGTVPERDHTELALLRAAVERDMPVLGICRGMQILNIARGGTLAQHVPESVGHEEHRRNPGSFENSEHDVRLEPGSLAARAAGEEGHRIKSHHHQAVDAIGEGLLVTGRCALDGLAEAIELPGKSFVLGVQWHPEVGGSSRLVAALVEQAREHRGAAVTGC